MTESKKHSIVLVDDHTLFRKGILELVNNFENYEVIWEASNGIELIDNLKILAKPEIILLDISMPEMDGFQAATIIKKKYPEIKILVLSMFDNEDAVIRMLKIGINGYILKDSTPVEFKKALDEMMLKGNYYSDLINESLLSNLISDKNHKTADVELTDREMEFLRLCCTDSTYKEIAEKMFISTRAVDHHRDNLFEKLKVKSRVGLVLFAIKNGYCKT